MKKTIIVLLFFLISCSPSDDNIENNNEFINDNSISNDKVSVSATSLDGANWIQE